MQRAFAGGLHTLLTVLTLLILAIGMTGCNRRPPAPEQPPPAVPFHRVEITDLSFADARHGWLARGAEILATEDGGRTWTQLYDTQTPYQIHGIQRLSREQGWYANEAGLFVTNDGGQSWAPLLTTSFLYGRFQFVDDRHGWVKLYQQGLQATQDGGKTWVPVQYPCGEVLGPFHFINSTTGWIVCPVGGGAGIETKKLFKTENGGDTWSLLAETGPLGGPGGKLPLSSYSRDLFFLDAQHGWLSTAKGDLLATRDGGQTWQALPRFGDLDELVAVQFLTPDQGYIVVTKVFEEVSSLLTTADGGETWTPVPTTQREPPAATAASSPTAITRTSTFEIAPDLRLTYRLTVGEADPVAGGTLTVMDSAGAVLLERTGVLQAVGLREVGAPLPVWAIEVRGGGSMGMYYEAYRYDAAAQRLRRLNWREQTQVVSRSSVQQYGRTVKTTQREPSPEGGWRLRFTLWQFRDGRLEPTAHGVEPVQPETAVPIAVDAPVPSPPGFPPPRIPVPQPPYQSSSPHPLPTETIDVTRVRATVTAAASDWGVPGTFHINSLWQITADLQLVAGYYSGVLVPGLVTLPAQGQPQFHALPRVGGGGPATIVGVKDEWVLIRTGLSYVVFDFRTGETAISDEQANPGQRTVFTR